MFFSGFNYKIEHIKGKNNGAADALSRLPLKGYPKEQEGGDYSHFLIEGELPIDAEKIRKEIRVDSELSEVWMYLYEGWPIKRKLAAKKLAHRFLELILVLKIYLQHELIFFFSEKK